LVPRALWWFRWSAAATFLSGVIILGLRRASWSDPWGLTILTGGRVRYRDARKRLARDLAQSADRDRQRGATAGGGQANPAAAGAARRAFLASRTNVVFSFPMLFFMGAASHFTLPAGGNRASGPWCCS